MLNCDAETGVCSLPESPDKALSHVPLTARFLRLTKRFHSLTGRHSDYFGAFSADEAGIELYQRLNSFPASLFLAFIYSPRERARGQLLY